MKSYLKKLPFVADINAYLKGKLQVREAKNDLIYYRNQARLKNIVVPETTDELRQNLRSRLAARGINVTPKAKSNLHIFLACYVVSWEKVLASALELFGKVTTFDWYERGFDDLRPDWLEHRAQMNAAMLKVFHTANRKQPIDAVVGYLSGHNTSPETLQEMARSGAVVFNFCWDDKMNYRGRKLAGRYRSTAAIAHAVDLNLTNAPDCRIKYLVQGGLALFWPEAAHPDVHCPYDVPFEFDVSFVGQCYSWRPAFIRRLEKLGIKVECFGRGWPNGLLSSEEMVKLYSRSRINLGFASTGYSRHLMHLKGRDFEVPMSGGLYLTQNNPELSLVYDVGREIVTYKNERDCVEKIQYLLKNPLQAEAIRSAGRKRALAEHTWEKRFEQIFEMAGILA